MQLPPESERLQLCYIKDVLRHKLTVHTNQNLLNLGEMPASKSCVYSQNSIMFQYFQLKYTEHYRMTEHREELISLKPSDTSVQLCRNQCWD